MPNDAKFGLVVGVGLVIASAALFFPKPQTADQSNPAAQIAAEAKKDRAMGPAMLPSPGSLPKPTTSGTTRSDPESH